MALAIEQVNDLDGQSIFSRGKEEATPPPTATMLKVVHGESAPTQHPHLPTRLAQAVEEGTLTLETANRHTGRQTPESTQNPAPETDLLAESFDSKIPRHTQLGIQSLISTIRVYEPLIPDAEIVMMAIERMGKEALPFMAQAIGIIQNEGGSLEEALNAHIPKWKTIFFPEN